MRAKLAGVVLFAVALALAEGAPAQQATTGTAITDIRQESSDRSTRLVVECTGPLAYTYYSPDPLTLVVDIPEVNAGSVPSRITVGTREVESLRVTQMARADGRNLARIEVRLASLVPYQVYSRDKRLHLVFERSAAAAAEPAAAKSEPVSPKPEPVAVAAVEPGFHAAWCRGLGRPELADAQHAGGVSLEAGWNALRTGLAGRTRDEAVELFAGAEACVSPVLSTAEVAASPLMARALISRPASAFPPVASTRT